MNKWWKHLVITAVVLLSVWFLVPTVRYYSMTVEARDALSVEERAKYIEPGFLSPAAIKLGLDLQGGMHLVLEVDDSKLDDNAKQDALDRAIEILRNRIDQFGVAEPVIQKQGNRRIIVQLPGLQDSERAIELIGRTAQLQFRLVRGDEQVLETITGLDTALEGARVVDGAVVWEGEDASTNDGEMDGMNAATEGDTDNTAAENAGDATGTDTTTVAENTATAFDTLIPEIPGADLEMPLAEISEGRPFSSYLLNIFSGALVIDARQKNDLDLLLATPQAQNEIPRDSEFLWSQETQALQGGGMGRLLYLVELDAAVEGSQLQDATTRPDPDDPSSLNVGFSLDRTGALKFARLTGENIGERLAIVLDDKIQSAPTIQTKIPNGEGRITGQFTDEEANDLAIVLRAGALPAPIEIKEERTVGPTLGRDSINLGIRAALIGFGIVLVFMVIYYQAAGLLACVALVLSLAIVLAVLAMLGAALTLPGIAGLILTIGMAVDANVLIFERIREELAKAKTVRAAIDAGYERAFTTILDANVTTLITAFVLWQFGTGPIKGFATVLSIGIVASMFTSLICTRVVFEMFTSRRQLKKLSI